jgi:hypothetical protein
LSSAGKARAAQNPYLNTTTKYCIALDAQFNDSYFLRALLREASRKWLVLIMMAIAIKTTRQIDWGIGGTTPNTPDLEQSVFKLVQLKIAIVYDYAGAVEDC